MIEILNSEIKAVYDCIKSQVEQANSLSFSITKKLQKSVISQLEGIVSNATVIKMDSLVE
jgi:hypothetical protein